MNNFLQLKKTAALAIGALALMSAAPAMADTIDFESLESNTYDGLNTFDAGDYHFAVIDSPKYGPNGTGFAGAIGNGNDPYLCAIAACPSGNTGMYYLGVNDGSVNISRGDSKTFSLGTIDYAFLAPVDNLPGYSYGQLTVTGITTGGGKVSYSFDFPELVGGNSPFLTVDLASKFGNAQFSSVTIGSCVFTATDCVNPSDNQAQFAFDNLTLAPVPEPQTYAMLGLGLAAMSLVSRRRAKQHNHV
ncbi:PEP-CTERM sorting domain-containing protein [Pseudoduganella sp. FT55W]|uniref:PEP-CTERM sorting domain-containing protein n=1 Tax=Duganella rivi TaxID=2666083 RepID=A0A7X4GWZ7_9BURK|nr:NF038120 family PEP-CTERM protein [Duganella rivi]MYM70277.1 PEP-CTERM sorting domain-containing protein [Duganella rivi]